MAQPHSPLASLPDDCLAAVLALVPFSERLTTSALVCKRWHRLVTSDPALLQAAELSFRRHRPGLPLGQNETADEAEQRLRSLLRFLARLEPHVQRLLLSIQAPYHHWEGQAAQLAAELRASLARCTHLAELSLSLHDVPCSLGPWLAPLASSLRRLGVAHSNSGPPRGYGPLQMALGGLEACTQLQALALTGAFSAPSAGCWPQGLTSLGLQFRLGDVLPESVAALQALQRLRMSHCEGRGDRWRPLAKLTALTELVLVYCSYLPPPKVLGCLARLQLLSLTSTPEGSARGSGAECEAEFDAALKALSRAPLSQLELVDCCYLELPPPRLSKLSSLRSLRFACGSSVSPDRIRLPAGGWLHSLQRLELSYKFIEAERARKQLEAATQLEELIVTSVPTPYFGLSLPPLRLLPWTAGGPRMRRLTLGLDDGWRREARQALGALTAAAAQVEQSSPGLTVRLVPYIQLHPEEQGLVWDPFA